MPPYHHDWEIRPEVRDNSQAEPGCASWRPCPKAQIRVLAFCAKQRTHKTHAAGLAGEQRQGVPGQGRGLCNAVGVVIDGGCAGFAAASVLLTEGMTVVKWPYALTTQIPCNIPSSCQQIAGPSSTSRRRAGPATCAMPTIRLMQRSAWSVRHPIRICPAEQQRAIRASHLEQQRRPPRVKVVQAVVSLLEHLRPP